MARVAHQKACSSGWPLVRSGPFQAPLGISKPRTSQPSIPRYGGIPEGRRPLCTMECRWYDSRMASIIMSVHKRHERRRRYGGRSSCTKINLDTCHHAPRLPERRPLRRKARDLHPRRAQSPRPCLLATRLTIAAAPATMGAAMDVPNCAPSTQLVPSAPSLLADNTWPLGHATNEAQRHGQRRQPPSAPWRSADVRHGNATRQQERRDRGGYGGLSTIPPCSSHETEAAVERFSVRGTYRVTGRQQLRLDAAVAGEPVRAEGSNRVDARRVSITVQRYREPTRTRGRCPDGEDVLGDRRGCDGA